MHKKNCNRMRTGGRYGQSNLLFSSSSERAPHNRVASKIDGWSPCSRVLFTSDSKSRKETVHSQLPYKFLLAPLPAQ